MKNYSVFDILGPIMIGPSSSHTAGAARLAKVASINMYSKRTRAFSGICYWRFGRCSS